MEVKGQDVLRPGGPAPKRLRGESRGLGGGGKHGTAGGEEGQQRGAGKQEQGRGKWSMPGFSVDP